VLLQGRVVRENDREAVLVEIFIILLHARYHRAAFPYCFLFLAIYLWVNTWRPKQPGVRPARAMRPNVERVPRDRGGGTSSAASRGTASPA
jgi:hypothetical protein